MLTEFGKVLRDMRKTRGERILDMADKLNVSPAFISNVEHGRKEPPSGFDAKLFQAYTLNLNEMTELSRAFAAAKSAFTISPDTNLEKETVAMFARCLPKIAPAELEQIQQILRRGK